MTISDIAAVRLLGSTRERTDIEMLKEVLIAFQES